MMYKDCKLCGFQDDIDYLTPLYEGRSNNFVLICEKCKTEIFSDRERSKREDHESGCGALNTMET